MYQFWEPKARKSLSHTLGETSCVPDAEASSEYSFQRRIHTFNTAVNSNNHEIIQTILIVFILSPCILETRCYDIRLVHYEL
jgi:hypothetical protein